MCLCVCQESASSAWEDIDHIQYSSCLKLPAKGIMDIGLGIPVPLGELKNTHHGLNNSESYCKVNKRLEIIHQSMHPEVFTKFMMSNSAGWLHIQALAFNASLVLLILTPHYKPDFTLTSQNCQVNPFFTRIKKDFIQIIQRSSVFV